LAEARPEVVLDDLRAEAASLDTVAVGIGKRAVRANRELAGEILVTEHGHLKNVRRPDDVVVRWTLLGNCECAAQPRGDLVTEPHEAAQDEDRNTPTHGSSHHAQFSVGCCTESITSTFLVADSASSRIPS